MKMFDQMLTNLLQQKREIEQMGVMKGDLLVLNIGTFVVKKGDKYYSNGSFSFDPPEQFDSRTATEMAFKLGGSSYKTEIYWGKKYATICQALANFK